MRIFGKYRGFVVDNNDPKKLRRLCVKVPSLFGDEVLEWAWPCEPYGGLGETGFTMVPEVGAGVWIEFEGGDVDYPIWSGCWSGAPGGTPEVPTEAENLYPANKVLKTKSGHVVELDDTQGAERIKVTCKDGAYVLIDAKSGQRRIELVENTLKLKLDRETGEMTLESPGRVKVVAPEVLLGTGGYQGVTTQAHPCLFLGAPHPGSSAVKAS
ncbi:MAG TPA: hypothetical protein GXX51_05770 [Firmicutes bacterium]|nr:hypothetical protein [Bacillota bacterium]